MPGGGKSRLRQPHSKKARDNDEEHQGEKFAIVESEAMYRLQSQEQTLYRQAPPIFVDLDGTLADFEGAARRIGAPLEDPQAMWARIAGVPDFWSALPWLGDGPVLWRTLLRMALPQRPTVLTGLPAGALRRRAEEQKRAWCRKHLGPEVPVLCVDSRDKWRSSGLGHVLVDDNAELRSPWEQQGGRFVLRKSAVQTVEAVQAALAATPSAPAEELAQSWKPIFSAVFLSDASRKKILDRYPPRHGSVHAEHVTLQVRPGSVHLKSLPLGQVVPIQVQDEVADACGQAVGVLIQNPELQEMCASGQAHITIATATGIAPRYSQELLRCKAATTSATPGGLQLEGVVGVRMVCNSNACSEDIELAARMLPSAVREQIENFASSAEAGEHLLIDDLGSTLRKAVLEFASALGLESKSGKRRNGKCQMQLMYTTPGRRVLPTKRDVTSRDELQALGFKLSPTPCADMHRHPEVVKDNLDYSCVGEEPLVEAGSNTEAHRSEELDTGGLRIGDVDLIAFLKHLSPSDVQLQERRGVVDCILTEVEAAFHGDLKALLVGSAGATLSSAMSDLDFALVPHELPSIRDVVRKAIFESDEERERQLLEKVANVMRRSCRMGDVQIVVTRSKAPSLIKCIDTKSGIHCDLVVRHGTGGALASVDKAALLRAFCEASCYFRPLALLVKQWAKSRLLVDSTARKLNSFTWTLMVAFFLQANDLLAVFDCSPEGLRQSRREYLHPQSQNVSADPGLKGLAVLLRGFFQYWRQFDYHAACASVRLGRCCNLAETGVEHSDSPLPFVVEDPVEPDENMARTLSASNLEEIRAELNRAFVLMQRGHAWIEICTAPRSKKPKELKAFYLPEQAAGSCALADLVAGACLPEDAKNDVRAFLEGGDAGVWRALPRPLSGAERRSVHHLANLCGIESKRFGKQSEGKHHVHLRKPLDWQQKEPGHAEVLQHWSIRDQCALHKAAGLAGGGSAPPGAMPRGIPSSSQVQVHSRLKIVQKLREGISLDKLQQRYKLVTKWHPRLPIVQLSYSQTESQMSSPIVQECRGLILEANTWNVVAFPFRKFFNHGERHAQALSWTPGGVRVYEKVDGSLLTLYWYQGSWHVATSKLPAADGTFPDGSRRVFAELFWQAWREKRYEFPADRDSCFMFELTSPLHTIIVRHGNTDLVCLGGRNLRTLEEITCEHIAEAAGWDIPKRFDPGLSTLDEVLAAARLLNPVAQEGFVVVDQQWRRLKIKSASYVALHHLGGNADRGGSSGLDGPGRRRSLLQIARNKEGDEFLAYYPELEQEFREVCARLHALEFCLEQGDCDGRGGSQVPRLLRKMRQQSMPACLVLREAKIQELEVAIEHLVFDSMKMQESIVPGANPLLTQPVVNDVLLVDARSDDKKAGSSPHSCGASDAADPRMANTMKDLTSGSSSESDVPSSPLAKGSCNRFAALATM